MLFLARGVARRLGPIGAAWTIYDIWKRLPEKERQYLVAQGRKHGRRVLKVMKQESAKIQSRFA